MNFKEALKNVFFGFTLSIGFKAADGMLWLAQKVLEKPKCTDNQCPLKPPDEDNGKVVFPDPFAGSGAYKGSVGPTPPQFIKDKHGIIIAVFTKYKDGTVEVEEGFVRIGPSRYAPFTRAGVQMDKAEVHEEWDDASDYLPFNEGGGH